MVVRERLVACREGHIRVCCLGEQGKPLRELYGEWRERDALMKCHVKPRTATNVGNFLNREYLYGGV